MANFSAEIVTKEYILKRVSQEEIFKKYLGIDRIQTKGLFRSPLRNDENPTCSFTYKNGKLYYRDWAKEYPKDCFGIVEEKYNLGFNDALKKIASDFNLADVEPKKELIKRLKEKAKKSKSAPGKPSKSIIHVSKGKFSQKDIEYLTAHGISSDAVKKFKCFPLSKVWINGDAIWHYTLDDPAIGYYFGTDEDDNQKWKIYFYERNQYRFLTNTIRLQGYPQLPRTGSHLVITKSMKDVMSLWEFGVTSVAPQNETTLISEKRVKEFRQRFDSLFSLYDFDYTGVKTANRMKRKYGIKRLFLTDGRFGYKDYGAKDFSDFVKHHGEKKATKLVKKAKQRPL